MDKVVKSALLPEKLTRDNFRRVKLDASEQPQTHFIDGDFLETFPALD